MAVFNVQVELEWFDEEEGLDEAIQRKVLANLENRLVKNAEERITDKLNDIISGMAERLTESFLEETLQTKINELKIPVKESSWSSEVKYYPIGEFIGKRYEKYLTEKKLDYSGKSPRHSSEAKISVSEYFINNYLEKEITEKITSMIKKARQDAEETIVTALENNLKDQLSSDIINRLNIPQMLESLQNKASELSGGKE